jgi:hypothetical protein
MRGKSGAGSGRLVGDGQDKAWTTYGIGNCFDELAQAILQNENLTTLLTEVNYKGAIVIHVESCQNRIKGIDFNYGYKVERNK